MSNEQDQHNVNPEDGRGYERPFNYPRIDLREQLVEWINGDGRKILLPDFPELDAGRREKNETVMNWIYDQRDLTRELIWKQDFMPDLVAALERWIKTDESGLPIVRGKKVFQWKRTADQGRMVLYVGPDLENQIEILNQNNMGGEIIDWTSISPDGRYVVYGVSPGDEKSVLHVLDLEQNVVLPIRIEDTRVVSIAWLPDCTGFYYTRYMEEGNYDKTVFLHMIGTELGSDVEIFKPENKKIDYPDLEAFPEANLLIKTDSRGWKSTNVFFAKMDDAAQLEWQLLAKGNLTTEEMEEGKVGTMYIPTQYEKYFYIRTNLGANLYQVARVRCDKEDQDPSDQAHWESFIPEDPEKGSLVDFKIVGGKGILHYQHWGISRLEIMDLETFERIEVKFGVGSVKEFWGEQRPGSKLYYSFESFNVPKTVYECDVVTYTTGIDNLAIGGLKFDKTKFEDGTSQREYLENMVVKQVVFPSEDGTMVRGILVHHKDLKKNGKNRALTYGYAGFGWNVTPSFTGSCVEWVNGLGIGEALDPENPHAIYFAIQARGGAEDGEEWHRAGMLGNKQNGVDDLIAGAEYLIREGYTSPEYLAATGGSNGALGFAIAMEQRPDLWAAHVWQFPLLDFLHFIFYTFGESWSEEFGHPKDPAQFDFLFRLSPVHNVLKGLLPAVLMQAGWNDNRVDARDALLMTKFLQEANLSDFLPILLSVWGLPEKKAKGKKGKSLLLKNLGLDKAIGHGINKSTSTDALIRAEFYGFFYYIFGLLKQKRLEQAV